MEDCEEGYYLAKEIDSANCKGGFIIVNILKIEIDTYTYPNEVHMKLSQSPQACPEDIWPAEAALPGKTIVLMGQSTLTVPSPVRDLGLVLKIVPETVRLMRRIENPSIPPSLSGNPK